MEGGKWTWRRVVGQGLRIRVPSPLLRSTPGPGRRTHSSPCTAESTFLSNLIAVDGLGYLVHLPQGNGEIK